MKTMKVIRFFILNFFVYFLISCSSLEQSNYVLQSIDYTIEDVRNEEIKRINVLLEEDPIQAYWRAYLLNDSKTLDLCAEKVVESYKKSLSEEKWFLSKKYYDSLKKFGYEKLNTLEKDDESLNSLLAKNIPVFDANKKTNEKVSKYILGTVTIWVDKGIRIENGMGFADRVIGSGFFISKDGYLITNHHVIQDMVNPKYEGYSKLFVKLANDSETRIPAKVVGWDSAIDLALLKVEIEAPYVFNLGSSKDLSVGDKIYCIGSPIGLERTLTSGIVSATDRMLFSAGAVMQIDAAVNSGNSGGPCIDEFGNVQAIVFAGMLQYEGLNFAIPVEYLKEVLPGLYSGGKYEHSWLEAYGRTKKSLGKEMGVEIQYVMPSGNAYRTGLEVGDILTSVDGTKINNLEDLQSVMIGKSAKSILNITVCKNGNMDDVENKYIYVSERPINPGYKFYSNDIIANSFYAIYGMKLKPVSTSNKKKYAIESVIRGSIADESGFSENDPIEVRKVDFNDEKNVIFSEIYTKNRKKGYLDIKMGLSAPLDSPYYF